MRIWSKGNGDGRNCNATTGQAFWHSCPLATFLQSQPTPMWTPSYPLPFPGIMSFSLPQSCLLLPIPNIQKEWLNADVKFHHFSTFLDDLKSCVCPFTGLCWRTRIMLPVCSLLRLDLRKQWERTRHNGKTSSMLSCLSVNLLTVTLWFGSPNPQWKDKMKVIFLFLKALGYFVLPLLSSLNKSIQLLMASE